MARMDFLPLPHPFDKRQMWHAIELLNHGSYTITAELQRSLHKAWQSVRETGMSDLEPPRHVEQGLPEHLQRMPQVERAIAMIVSERI